MDVLIDQLKIDIENKKASNQSQQIDNEVLAYISIYKYGNKLYSSLAKKWLQFFLVNAGYAEKLSDLS
ncbi:hypothetical protein ACFFH2_15710 [Enterococcus devriesei]|uniref:Uncharacterized protein n=1 Tax=Enterococcus devriesei TaxID=319970 RepID=A0A1L8SLB1_9ENTE|nr:hypothetical protein [Enterococcus devriesei]OJG32704.1 hypothetical protein RV00_GL001546 [Enterococcus devriesei]